MSPGSAGAGWRGASPHRAEALSDAGAQKATYARLFVAHCLGLLGTGVATVALALLAFDLAGDYAGAVLGTALSIKMAVNIVVAPIASAFVGRQSRRLWLTGLALVRAGALGWLPFVESVWEIYLLIAVFQGASAVSAATYLAIVPDLLPDETDYARALAKSKIAYELESLLSPLAAALLLMFISHRGVFVAAVIMFVLAAFLFRRLDLPAAGSARRVSLTGLVADLRRVFASPAMRGALLLNWAAITVGAMVMVNTVLLVRGVFDRDDQSAAIALGVFGAGGVVGALLLPRLIAGRAERRVMLLAGTCMAVLLAAGVWLPGFYSMLALWAALGTASTLAQLPVSTLISRMAAPGERQGLYAAHYSINHALLFGAYLAAGWVGAELGLVPAFLGLGAFSLAMVVLAALAWPRGPSAPAPGEMRQSGR